MFCVLCFFFSQGKIIKTYKRTTWLFVCVSVNFQIPWPRAWPRDAPKGIPRARRVDYRFFCRVCQKSVYPKVAKFSNFFFCWALLDSLNLFWLCTTIVPVIVCVCVVCVYPKKRYKNGLAPLPKQRFSRTITKNLSFSKSRFSFCFLLNL